MLICQQFSALTRHKLLLAAAPRAELWVELLPLEPLAVSLEVSEALLGEGSVGEAVVRYRLAPHLNPKKGVNLFIVNSTSKEFLVASEATQLCGS